MVAGTKIKKTEEENRKIKERKRGKPHARGA